MQTKKDAQSAFDQDDPAAASPDLDRLAHSFANVKVWGESGPPDNQIPAGAQPNPPDLHRALVASQLSEQPATPIQRYKEEDQDAGPFCRIADDDSLAVPMDSNLGSQTLYGDPTTGVVAAANVALGATGSPITLAYTANTARLIVRSQYLGGGKRLRQPVKKRFTQIEPQHNTQGAGAAMDLLKDCGQNTREVMGGGSADAHFDDSGGAAATTPAASPLVAVARIAREHFAGWQAALDPLIATYTGPHADAAAKKAAYSALDTYLSNQLAGLSAVNKAAFLAAAGLNENAAPDVGEGVAIVGLGARKAAAAKKWKFHMAPVVIKSADNADYATLENFNTIGPARNRNWNFNMYGTAHGRSIHEDLAEQNDSEFGATPLTTVVKKH